MYLMGEKFNEYIAFIESGGCDDRQVKKYLLDIIKWLFEHGDLTVEEFLKLLEAMKRQINNKQQ